MQERSGISSPRSERVNKLWAGGGAVSPQGLQEKLWNFVPFSYWPFRITYNNYFRECLICYFRRRSSVKKSRSHLVSKRKPIFKKCFDETHLFGRHKLPHHHTTPTPHPHPIITHPPSPDSHLIALYQKR